MRLHRKRQRHLRKLVRAGRRMFGGPGGAASQSTFGGSSTPAGLSAVDKLATTAQAGALAPLAGASPLTGNAKYTFSEYGVVEAERARCTAKADLSSNAVCFQSNIDTPNIHRIVSDSMYVFLLNGPSKTTLAYPK